MKNYDFAKFSVFELNQFDVEHVTYVMSLQNNLE